MLKLLPSAHRLAKTAAGLAAATKRLMRAIRYSAGGAYPAEEQDIYRTAATPDAREAFHRLCLPPAADLCKRARCRIPSPSRFTLVYD